MLTPLLSKEEVGKLARSQLDHLYMELAIKACKLEQRVAELEAGKAEKPSGEALDDSKKKHQR